jgi:periplasmic binding family protein
MKLSNSSKLAAAISLALGSAGANALDLATTQGIVNAPVVGPAVNAPNVLVVAGASAMRGSFITLLNQDVCQAGTLDAYRANTGAPDFRAYSCRVVTTGPNTGVLGANLLGQNIVVYYRSEGGSAWGPYSIAQRAAPNGTSTGTNFPGISALNLGAGSTCATAAVTAALDGVNVLTHACTLTGTYSLANDTPVTGLTLMQTELGTSDVEPKLFTDTNNPANAPTSRFVNSAAVVTSLKGLSASRIFGQVFALIGNTSDASGLSDNVTNLTTAEVTGILSGNIGDWCQIAQVANHADCVSDPVVEHPITVVRREPGSGTQVGAAAHFLKVNCSPESLTFVTTLDNGAIEAPSTASLEGSVGSIKDAIGINIYKSAQPGGTKTYTLDGIAADRYTAAWGNDGNDGNTPPTSPFTSVRKYNYAFEATMTRAPTILSGTVKTALASALITLSQRVNGLPNTASVFGIPGVGGNIPGMKGANPLNQPVSNSTTGGSACRNSRS